MLKPIAAFFERIVRNRILAIFTAYILAVTPLFFLLFFFFNQTRILFSGLPSFRERLNKVVESITDWSDQKFNLDAEATSTWVSERVLAASDISMDLVGESLQSTTNVLVNMVLIALITYFLLLYRSSLKNFILVQVQVQNRDAVEQLLDKIQNLTKRYMIGQGLVITVLGLLIGSGLWLIGVPYPFFWGFLAGFFEIVPYVGTSIGGLLPFFYMLMVSDTLWQPFAVVGLYILVQQIEGNLISPNIMGQSIRINPLFIILGLFIGGIMWGVAGMILVLPILAISKEVFRSFEITEPFSYLMEDGLARNKDVFLQKFDQEKYRIFNFFFQERKP